MIQNTLSQGNPQQSQSNSKSINEKARGSLRFNKNRNRATNELLSKAGKAFYVSRNHQSSANKNNSTQRVTDPTSERCDDLGPKSHFIFHEESNLFSGINYRHTKTIEFLYYQMIINVTMQCVFAIISVLSGFIQYEIEYDNTDEKASLLGMWICFISSLGLWMTFVFEYLIDCEINFYLKKLPEAVWRRTPSKIFDMMKNFIVFFLHPNPVFAGLTVTIYNEKYNVDQVLSVNSIMFIICMLRMWFIIKTFVIYSDYSSSRTQRICQMNSFSTNFTFAIKAIMQSTPYHVYGLMLIISLVYCSYGLRIFERGLDSLSGLAFGNYWNCIWCIIITMTTVGFGDFYPSSIIGRIIGIVSCFIGVFLISMLVVTITNLLNLSVYEKNAYLILEKTELKKDKDELAKKVITKYFKLNRNLNSLKQKQQESDVKHSSGNTKIKYDFKAARSDKYSFLRSYNDFKEKIDEIETTYPSYSTYDAISDNLNYLDGNFSKIEDKQNSLNNLINEICDKLQI